jgi:hypothetical protein
MPVITIQFNCGMSHQCANTVLKEEYLTVDIRNINTWTKTVTVEARE